MSADSGLKKKPVSTVIIVLIGTAATVVLFLIVRDVDYRRIQESFKRSADERYAALQREIESDLQMLVSSKSIDAIDPLFKRNEFREFVRPLLARYHGRQGIGWVPRVPDVERNMYEENARRDGHRHFTFKERNAQGAVVTAARRYEYYPVYYIEPLKGNEPALGFDLASHAVRREAIMKAMNRGEMAATRRITLLPDALKAGLADQYGFLVFEPVYRSGAKTDTVGDRRRALKGFILGVYRTGDIVERSVSYLKPEAIDIILYASSNRDKDHFLYHHQSRLHEKGPGEESAAAGEASFEYTREMAVAGQNWLIVFTPGSSYVGRNRSPWSWMVLLFGTITTAVIYSSVRGSIRYAERLSLINDELSRESQERRQVAEALQKSEERLQLQIDRMPIGCITWDTDFRVVSWNPAAENIFGYTEKEAIGKYPIELIAPEGMNPYAEEFTRQIMDGGITANNVHKNVTKNGRTIICSWSNTPLIEKNGHIIGALSMVQDITAAKRSEDLYKTLAERSLVGVFIVQDGKFRFINESGSSYTGYSTGDILGRNADNLIHPDDKAMCSVMAREMLSDARTEAYEYRIINKDGQVRWLSQKVTPIIYNDRRAILGYSLDVTNLKESLTRLKEIRALESSIMSAIPHVVVGIQGDHILFVNEAAESIFGWKPEELIGRTLDVFCQDGNECRDLTGQLQAEAAHGTSARRETEIHCRHRDGRNIVCKVTSCRTGESAGGKIVAIFEDVTAKKMSQIQLLQAEKMASIGKLAAGVAHEINNPTAFVSSNLRTLSEYVNDMITMRKAHGELIQRLHVMNSEGRLPENIVKEIRQVEEIKSRLKIDLIIEDVVALIAESREGTERISRIVQDLKNFAHPGEEKETSFNVNENVESTLNIVWNELKYKAVVHKDYGDIPRILGYPQQLNQVFMNLLVNAAQAIKDKGEIRISTKSDGGYIEIGISDTGVGIPPENLPKLFDPFFTTKEVGKGTGLGLHVAYSIIEKHNGSIDVQSTVGAGTTFTVRIPTHLNI